MKPYEYWTRQRIAMTADLEDLKTLDNRDDGCTTCACGKKDEDGGS